MIDEQIGSSQSAGAAAEELSTKTQAVFGSMAIDKRRLPMSQLKKRGVPAYVGEWLLDTIVPGNGPISADDATKVQDWAKRNIPGADEQNVIKNRLLGGESLKVLTPVQVEVTLKRKRQDRVAKLALLAIDDAAIPDQIIKLNPALLKEGMWGVTELINTSEGPAVISFQPMQAALNLALYKGARADFSVDQWRSLMLLSMGYNPLAYTVEQQLVMLARLLPLVQKNMTLAELAPKGTGKSYVYENISPRVRLLTSDISPAVLFVNNASGQWGLLARFSVVVLDEIHKMRFTDPEGIISGLQGYLANGELSRGGLHKTASDCGLVILANISLDDQQRPAIDPLVRELPPFLQEPAFIDRIKGIIPGWQLPKLSDSCLASTVGLKSDFFGDALIALRNDLSADQICARRIKLCGDRPYIRNEEAVRAMASGFMKILFPDCHVSDEDFVRYCVEPARELRQIVWDQLYQVDAEYRQYSQLLTYELRA